MLGADAAHAQSAEAEQRYTEAEALLSAGKVAEACDAFEASNRLEPGAGVLIQIGLCKEKLGKLASALAAYQSALERVKDPSKKAIATGRVAALEPRVSRLTITVTPEAGIDGLVISRDGRPVDEADYGRAVPIDGGSYEIEAKAPGRLRWSRSIRVEPEGDKASVSVPALEKDQGAAAAARPERPAEPRSSRKGLKIAGWGLAGLTIMSGAYVMYATVAGPITAYEDLGMQPVDANGIEISTGSASCADAGLRDLSRGEANTAFDKACTANRNRWIVGGSGLVMGIAAGVTLFYAYRDERAPAVKSAALGGRTRRELAVTPVLGPGSAGALLRLAW